VADRPKMGTGDSFRLTGFSKLEDLDAGEWKIERMGSIDGEPTYIMRPKGGGELVQHFVSDVDMLLEGSWLKGETVPHIDPLNDPVNW